MLGSSGLGSGGRRTNPRFFFAGLMLLLPFCACGSDGDSSPSVSSTDSAKPTPTPAFTETSSTLPPEDDVAGDLAVWKVAAADSLSAESESFTAYVTRLGRSGGVTGEVYAPVIVVGDRDIVVTFSVAPLDLDVRPCLSNEEVPFVVDIGEPIGERRLVDGACLDDGEASSTGFCRSGPERWSP